MNKTKTSAIKTGKGSNMPVTVSSDRTEEIKALARKLADQDHEKSDLTRKTRFERKLKEEAKAAVPVGEKPSTKTAKSGVSVSAINPDTKCRKGSKGDFMGKVMLRIGADNKDKCITEMAKVMAKLMEEEGDDADMKSAQVRAAMWYMTLLRDKAEVYDKKGGHEHGVKGVESGKAGKKVRQA